MKLSPAVMLTLAIAAPADAITARGMPSCGEWVSHRAEINVRTRAAESWLVGYLSGIAGALDKDFLPGTDNPSIFLWADNYCRANPLKSLGDAGNALTLELLKSKGP